MKTSNFSSKGETHAWVKGLAKDLSRPCAVLLSGALGAGKTQVGKWLLHELGVSEISSPTFAVHNEYDSPSGAVDHVDLYRLKSDADLESSGFWDLLTRPRGLLLVEWADRLPEDVWPKTWRRVFIRLEKTGEEGRRVEWRIEAP